MLRSNVWKVLLGRQKLFGRVSCCLHPHFLSPTKWMSFPFLWTRIRIQETWSQRMQHLSHLRMSRKGIFSELLYRVFQFSPFFEGCLSNLLLDFLTWHTTCSAAFLKKSFWIYAHHTEFPRLGTPINCSAWFFMVKASSRTGRPLFPKDIVPKRYRKISAKTLHAKDQHRSNNNKNTPALEG